MQQQQQQQQGRTTSTEKTAENSQNSSIIAVATGRQRQLGGPVRISACSHSAIAPPTRVAVRVRTAAAGSASSARGASSPTAATPSSARGAAVRIGTASSTGGAVRIGTAAASSARGGVRIGTLSAAAAAASSTRSTAQSGTSTATSTTEEPVSAAAAAAAAVAAAAAAAAAAKEKIEEWRKSKAKAVLDKLLRDKNSWVHQMIDSNPTWASNGRSQGQTIKEIHDHHNLLEKYPLPNFKTNFKNLKNSIDREFDNVKFDQDAFNREKLKYPKEQKLKIGYPRWNHPDNKAKQFLEDDTKEGGIYDDPAIKPRHLRAMRPEYQQFPKEIFRNRLYRVGRSHKEEPYWIHKRNKNMNKQKLTEEDLEAKGTDEELEAR